ncbi:MAG TPA: flagellar motor protein MotB [Syntrophorhabdaceae bacterium]|jgi:chemotaxis protein MotB
MRRKKKPEEQENHERWLLTYADLITLLLAFFIMMYTLSKQDAQRYQEVSSYLKAIFTGGTAMLNHPSASANAQAEASAAASPPNSQALNEEIMKQLQEEIKSVMSLDEMKKNFTIFVDERGIVVRALDKAFFDEGKADLKPRAKDTINKIIPILKKVAREVRIEGHTDNVPISTHDFKSNWELSVRRATEVVRYVIELGDFPPELISAAGYAEYRPLMDNSTAEQRASNRRIEIIIEKPEPKAVASGQPTVSAASGPRPTAPTGAAGPAAGPAPTAKTGQGNVSGR